MAYCIATAIYYVWQTRTFDFAQYLNYLVHFNISGPHYFVLLYLQLMLANRFLYNILQKCERNTKGYFTEAVMMVLSIWTTNCTNILNVYGGENCSAELT